MYKILYDNCEILGHKNCVYFVKKYLSELFFFNWGRKIINKSFLLCIKQRNLDNVTQSMYACANIDNPGKLFFTSI